MQLSPAAEAPRWLASFRDNEMLKISSSNQNDIEISGSALELSAIARDIFALLESDAETVVFNGSHSFDPSPYDSVVKKLSVAKGQNPANVSLIPGEEVRVEGSPESLKAFASFFEFEPDASVGDHSHFEYEDYEGNRFVSRGSIPVIISVR